MSVWTEVSASMADIRLREWQVVRDYCEARQIVDRASGQRASAINSALYAVARAHVQLAEAQIAAAASQDRAAAIRSERTRPTTEPRPASFASTRSAEPDGNQASHRPFPRDEEPQGSPPTPEATVDDHIPPEERASAADQLGAIIPRDRFEADLRFRCLEQAVKIHGLGGPEQFEKTVARAAAYAAFVIEGAGDV